MTTWYKFISNRFSMAGVILAALILTQTVSLQADSLWIKSGHNEKGMFADTRASDVGDIILVIVSESARMTASQDTKTEKKSGISNAVTKFLFSPAASGFGTHNGELPATEISGSNSFEGSGSITNNQTLTTQFSVRVIDRLPNGVLVIEGVKVVAFAKERHFAVLTGFVRARDITANNSVSSSRIADAHLEMLSEGSLSEAQRRGWITKINDLINPF